MSAPLPPLSLLDAAAFEPVPVDHKARVAAIHRALEDFEVEARVVRLSGAPSVTTYELELAPGTRVAKLLGLAPDLAVQLGVPSLRVFYPLPGKTTVGLEVPNPRTEPVRLRRVMELTGKRADSMALPLFLGEGADEAPIVADLAELPHLLVAGTTGAGKSSCLEAVIASLLMTRTADDVKLILIDPKQTELAAFRDVPHLLAPVVTDARRAAGVLGWLVRQMEVRYDLFAQVGVKRIEQFNKLGPQAVMEKLTFAAPVPPDAPTHLPHIVVVIDELADLMMTGAKEVERAIQRLSQKSRAVGIHLIIATQRPSVDVLTGLLKSNLPSRIAFRVAANVDSRTIVDQPGAEKLLGKGDMLLMLNGSQQLVRGQGTWVAEAERKRVLAWLREHGGKAAFDAALCTAADADFVFQCDDELFDRAAVAKPASSRPQGPDPLLQAATLLVLAERRGGVERLRDLLGVSWERAASLMQALESAGVVERHPETGEWRVRISLREWRKKRGA